MVDGTGTMTPKTQIPEQKEKKISDAIRMAR
jgi:hypothetical protein